MTVAELKDILCDVNNDGYGDWSVFMCDDDDDDFTINHIYLDEDDDLCLESTDAEDNTYDFTCNDIIERLSEYSDDTYVYFREEYEDESWCDYNIDDNWYIGSDDDGYDILNIDCYPCDDDSDNFDYEDDNQAKKNDSDLEDISDWDCWSTHEDLVRDIEEWHRTIDKEGHL